MKVVRNLLQISNDKIIKMMRSNPVVIDDKTGLEKRITGLVEFNDSQKTVACCFDSDVYDLRQCYIINGKLHCDSHSISGVLLSNAYPTAEQLREYNKSCLRRNAAPINCFYNHDGSVVYHDEVNGKRLIGWA